MRHCRHSSSNLLRLSLLRLLPGLVFVFVAAALLTGCGGSNADAAASQPQYVRTPHPTFTPTPMAEPPAAQPPAAGGEPNVVISGSPQQPVDPTPPPTAALPVLPPEAAELPIAVINTDLVNARTGPGTSFTIVTILGRGEQFDITGKDASGQWWRVCCIEGEEAWVVGEFIDTDGAVDSAPVLDENSPPSAQALQQEPAPGAEQPTATATQAPAAAAPTDTPAPPTDTTQTTTDSSGFEFNLIAQEQFPETNVVRVFLFAYSGGDGLEGYSLRVSKDGVELPVNGESFGGRPGLTWPIADQRQRSQNFKVEFPGQSPAGVWEIQLVKGGAPVGPPVQFTLQANDPNRELYVRYERP